MNKVDAFEKMIAILRSEPEVSIFVRAEVLFDMGINPRHIEETCGRVVRRRAIVTKGSDGLHLDEIEFEFLPKRGNS